MKHRSVKLLACTAVIAAAAGAAHEVFGQNIPLTNWSVPASSSGRTRLGIGDPGMFVSLPPCRVADTRVGSGFTGAYGPPNLTQGVVRSFPITGQCGIPTGAAAVSFNFTVTGTQGPGHLVAFPQGGAQPTSSVLNFAAGWTIANAIIIPLGGGGLSVVAGSSNTDLIIDINGYFFDKDSTLPNGAPAYHYLGVIGTIDPNAGIPYGAIFAQNNSAQVAYSIKADITNANAGAAAIAGRQLSTAAANNYGLLGINQSTSVNSAGVRGESSGGGLGYGVMGIGGGSNYGVYAQGGYGGTGAKYFIEPHPTDAALVIRYIAMEGPESGVYFRGRSRFENKVALIPVPEDFRIVTDPEGLTVHLTPVGGPAQTWVSSMSLDGIVVEANRDVDFSYVVYGVRKAFKDHRPIAEGSEFMPDSPTATIPQWLTEEAKRRLIANGTYNPDGTVNMATAQRLGWTEVWKPSTP